MKKLQLLLLATAVFLTSSCGVSPKRAAKDFCNCLQPLADVMVLQDTLKAQNLIDSLANVSITAEDVWNDAQTCMEEKQKEYGQKATKAAFKKKARALIKERCPEVWERTPKY